MGVRGVPIENRTRFIPSELRDAFIQLNWILGKHRTEEIAELPSIAKEERQINLFAPRPLFLCHRHIPRQSGNERREELFYTLAFRDGKSEAV